MSTAGKYYGANQLHAIPALMKTGFIMGMTYTSCLALLFIIFRHEMITLFLTGSPDDHAIVNLAQFMLIGLICYMLADAVIQVSTGILRGIGDTRWMMFTSISIYWLMLIIQIIMIKALDRDSREVWVVFVITLIVTAVIFSWRLRQRPWLPADSRTPATH